MKFEKMLIACVDMEQTLNCEKILKSFGYKPYSNDSSCSSNQDLFIHVYDDGDYQSLCFGSNHDGAASYSYEQFIEKYENEMIKKIHQAKKELGLNNSELSLKMGKSRPYIAKMLNQPQSEKVQNKVIKEIDELLGFDRLCKAKEYAKVMSGKTEITIENNSKEVEISALKKIIESKDLAISGLIKQNDEAKKIHDKDINTLVEVEGNLIGAKIDLDRTKVELDYFVNQYKQSEEDVNSLKSKIKRERIIILIVIAILTALFFLKGSIGG